MESNEGRLKGLWSMPCHQYPNKKKELFAEKYIYIYIHIKKNFKTQKCVVVMVGSLAKAAAPKHKTYSEPPNTRHSPNLSLNTS